jgi:FkbM family methyltransferase
MTGLSFDDLGVEARRLRTELGDLHSRKLAIYGAGFLGRWARHWLPENGYTLTTCFDSNPARIGGDFDGLPIRDPFAAGGEPVDLTLITARHAVKPVSARLAEAGMKHMPFEAFFVALRFEDFAREYETLADDRSREVLRVVLNAMLTGDARLCETIYEKDQYFCLPPFCGVEEEIYIDAGAYVGDSVERFLWAHAGNFKAIHAFEPAGRQFAALTKRCERLTDEWAIQPGKLQINHMALGASRATLAGASQSGQAQSYALTAASADEPGIPVVSLDDYLQGGPASFIKADVEGMEMALLAGARQTIATFRPRLAICAYHYPSDIPDIMSAIRAICPDYQFALRHHAPRQLETVLYAWID